MQNSSFENYFFKLNLQILLLFSSLIWSETIDVKNDIWLFTFSCRMKP